MSVRAQAAGVLKLRTKVTRSIGAFEGLAILAMLVVVAVCIAKRSLFFNNAPRTLPVLGASLEGYILAFFITSYGLKRQGLGFERVFYALAATAASRWLYEIAYHYAFLVHMATLLRDIKSLSTNISETSFPLIWSLWVVLVIFTGHKYMSLNKWFYITLASSMMLFLFWIEIGYPQWIHPEQWPYSRHIIYLIPRAFIHAPNGAARSLIFNVSVVIESVTKIIVCALLPCLFLGKNRRVK